MLLVTCSNPDCRAQMFLSRERLPVCGKCNQPISLETMKAAAKAERRRGSVFSFLRNFFRQQSPTKHDGPIRPDFPILRKKADGLIKRAWPGNPIGTVVIDPRSIPGSVTLEEFVSRLLHHARHTTDLSTPWRTPRVFVEKTSQHVGGLFVVDEGWVRIVVGQDLFKDVAAARAVLCHEVCHYILDMVDIRERPTQENERLTDVAMFVFGFGAIFRAGYRRAPAENRTGHRVGYLSDEEYRFLENYIATLARR
jgi:hypothetical protein